MTLLARPRPAHDRDGLSLYTFCAKAGARSPRCRRVFGASAVPLITKSWGEMAQIRSKITPGEGRFLAACKAELAAHLGGEPTPAARVVIDRLSWLRLHVVLIDERAAGGVPVSAHDQRAYLAFSNAISHGMRQLGLKGAAEKPPSLADYLASCQTEAAQ